MIYIYTFKQNFNVLNWFPKTCIYSSMIQIFANICSCPWIFLALIKNQKIICISELDKKWKWVIFLNICSIFKFTFQKRQLINFSSFISSPFSACPFFSFSIVFFSFELPSFCKLHFWQSGYSISSFISHKCVSECSRASFLFTEDQSQNQIFQNKRI